MSKRDLPVEPVAVVVGRNANLLRGGRTVDDVAARVTACGLKWGRGRISDLEAGRVVPRLETLLVLCQAFSDLLGRDVALADLLAGDGRVDISDAAVPLSVVRAALGGAPVALEPRMSALELLKRDFHENVLPTFGAQPQVGQRRRTQLFDVWQQYGEAEERAARALGVDKGRLLELMTDRWGRALSVERDARAGPGASAQKRGQITRQLREDLRKAIEESTDGDD